MPPKKKTPAAPEISAASEYTSDATVGEGPTGPLVIPQQPTITLPAPAATTLQEEPPVSTSVYDIMLNPPTMQHAATDYLKKLKKKVHDGIVEPARGVIIGTGIIGVDMVMDGGVNFGSVHEFYGFSKTGKSYLMQKVGVTGQTRLSDCIVVILDRENAYDRARVLSVGFDPSRTIVIPAKQIPEPEHVFDVMRETTEEIEKEHFARLGIERADKKEKGDDGKKKKGGGR